MLRRVAKIGAWCVAVILLGLLAIVFYIRSVGEISPPTLAGVMPPGVEVTQTEAGLFVTGNNWFRKSESGLYELYVEGDPYERGVAIGALTRDLARYQEGVFQDQIRTIVPSSTYREALKYFIGWFNRDLDKHVPEEYKLEIYGVSQYSSDDYDHIAKPYQRILNYHAAHDIGHALQNMSLVGCTSFATWGDHSDEGTLTIGRNFDFYVGEAFARNKIVAFYNPDDGHRFMMVTFGGMIGVLSGMNMEGLTVTINAAKSEIPFSAATPVSLVAREILQYASTIEEAYAIAAKREIFVSESFLVGSAKDGRAAIIEKSNDVTAIYDPKGNSIVCTNHFQSELLGNTELNQEHIRNSASAYRYRRVEELLDRNRNNTVESTVSILRDQRGINDEDIGFANEKTINQLIAHHSIVFQPEKKLVWVSTAPWQLGKFVCYDLNRVFGDLNAGGERYSPQLEIPADSFLLTSSYRDCRKFNQYRLPFSPRDGIHPDSVVRWNPNSYYSYMLAGDYYYDQADYNHAIASYETALTKEVATEAERAYIVARLDECKSRQR